MVDIFQILDRLIDEVAIYVITTSLLTLIDWLQGVKKDGLYKFVLWREALRDEKAKNSDWSDQFLEIYMLNWSLQQRLEIILIRFWTIKIELINWSF